MSAKLTVLIPCKNEQKNIGFAIESARPVADEILVADSLSTDGTLDLVRRLGGCRIIQREFVGYADFKNWAIPQAAWPWVLVLDADERISPELAEEIRQVLADPPEGIDAYDIPRRNFFLGREIRHCGWTPDTIRRLVRRDVCRYGPERVHESFQVDRRRVGRMRGKLSHYVYWNLDQWFERRLRYATLSAEDLWERGRRADFGGLFLRPMFRFFQLYLIRGGFLDGLAGLQVCMLTAFFNTFVRQARLWEMEHSMQQPEFRFADEAGDGATSPMTLPMRRDAAAEENQPVPVHAAEIRRAA
jgi:glycosyltransferase involved in cell wall biosynthesis